MGITQIYAQCYQCTGTNNTSFSIGSGLATGNNSFAGGNQSGTTADNSFVFGNLSTVNGLRGIALGNETNVSHTDGIAIGNFAISNAANSYVFGQNVKGTASNTISIGLGTSSLRPLTNSIPNSIMFGVTRFPTLTIVQPAGGSDVGYLGIGTDDPKQKVHIDEGNLLITSANSGTSNAPTGALLFADVIDNEYPHGKWGIEYLESNDPVYGGTGLNFRNFTKKQVVGAIPSVLFLSNNRNIGIGTKDPQAKLDVVGLFKSTNATIDNTLTANTLSATNANVDNTLTVNNLSLRENLGIGIDEPREKLHVNGGNIKISNYVHPTIELGKNAMVFGFVEGEVQTTPRPSEWGIERIILGSSNYGLNFWKYGYQNGGSQDGDDDQGDMDDAPRAMVYSSILFFGGGESNRVGIGTNNPQAKLDVSGDLKAGSADITNTLKAKSADITGNIKALSASVGNLQINTDASQNKAFAINSNNQEIFSVTGSGTLRTKDMLAEKIEVKPNAWSDHVFYPEYELRSLPELEQYIKQNGTLPEIPSEKEVKENGIDLGDMQSKLLLKIEELTLYILQQEKKMADIQNQINELKK